MTSSVLLRDTLWNVPFWAALGVVILAGSSDVGHAAEPPPGAALLQQLRSFATMGSVLYVAAHPDDENTQVITYLARGRGYRTAYLSLHRGDGGQNLSVPSSARRSAWHARRSCSPPAGSTAVGSTSPAPRTSATPRAPRRR